MRTYRWNSEIVESLNDGVMQALKDCNVTKENIFETDVSTYHSPITHVFTSLQAILLCELNITDSICADVVQK
jgi:6,7-dimethyl-8-ribityllumazine synthase